MKKTVRGPLEYINKIYSGLKPKYSFKDKNAQDYRKWQKALFKELIKALGINEILKEKLCALNPRITGKKDKGTYIQEKIIITTEPGVDIPFYLLIPKNKKFPLPLGIAVHGHGPGKVKVVGESKGTFYDDPYGKQGVEEGYVIAAPDLRGFGELMREDDRKEGKTNSCATRLMNALLFGRTMIGEKVFDVSRIIDYCLTRKEVDKDRIFCYGNSGGGTTTLFSAAYDKRIKLAAVSCYFCTFKDSIIDIRHCACNYVPGMLKLGEMYDIAGLIAPRPLLIIAGKQDDIFPIKGVEFAFKKLQKIYAVAGSSKNLEKHIGAEGHRFYRERIWDFVKEHFAKN